jgi:hypothetical protein
MLGKSPTPARRVNLAKTARWGRPTSKTKIEPAALTVLDTIPKIYEVSRFTGLACKVLI